MRFRELKLLRYGQFEDCTLNFEAAASDLQLIYGPNEAGKSTTLEAVGDLLFGFGRSTRFAFRFDQQLLRVGAVIEDAGASFEVRRRKGNSQTLLDANEQPIEPARLAAALGGQSREMFERMFGLDHERLRAGGEAILAARDDVGQAIFAAGSGLLRVSQVCDALDQESKAIWTPRAGESRTYTAASRAWQDARSRLRDAQVRPAAWAQARRAFDEATAELVTLRERRNSHEGELGAVERRRRTLGPLARRQMAITQLKVLDDAPDVPADALERFDAGERALGLAELSLSRAKASLAALDDDLKSAQPDPAVLCARDGIEALRESRGAVEIERAALPALRTDRDALLTDIGALQLEIGWPAETVAAAKARLPGRPDLAEVRDLLEQRATLDLQQATARESLEEATASLDGLRGNLALLPAPIDIKPLQAQLRTLRDEGDFAGQVAAAVALREELSEVLTSRLTRLAPWSGEIDALLSLVLPADDDIDRALSRCQAAEDGVDTARLAHTSDAEQVAAIQLQRRQAAREHPALDRDALEAARRERDIAWEPLERYALGGLAPTNAERTVADYVHRVTTADQVADLRFDHAEHAGRLSALDNEIGRVELRADQSLSRLVAAEAELDAASQAFDVLVAPIGIALSPVAYESWRDARASTLDSAAALAAATRDLESTRARETQVRVAMLAVLEGQAPADATLRALFALADQRIETGNAQHIERRTILAQIETAEAGVQRGRRLTNAANAADNIWSASWVAALGRLSLSADMALAGVRTRLELIETLRRNIETHSSLEMRIAAAEQAVADFKAAIDATAARCGQTSGSDPSETLARLIAVSSTASEKAARVLDLAARRETALGEKTDAEAAIKTAQVDLRPFLVLAPGHPLAEVREQIVRARDAARLRTEQQTAEAEIVANGDGLALPDLIASAEDADPDALTAEAAALSEQLRSLNREIEHASARRQTAETAFKALDDRPDAAIAAFEMAEARSELAFQAELYVRKRAQAKLLRFAIDRYRAEKQAPLLSRASELFQTLTLGRYRKLLVEYDGETPRLAGERSDGATVVPVGGMSQGTVDQLFLALRIAAVEDMVGQGTRLPFLADDLFINFDDARAAAGFRVLAELAQRTQVLFFTHHEHLLEVAQDALKPTKIVTCHLPRDGSVAAA
jgi:uncharacterized protein YhaN